MAEAGHFTNANEALAYPTEPTRTPLSFAHVVYLPQNLYAQPPNAAELCAQPETPQGEGELLRLRMEGGKRPNLVNASEYTSNSIQISVRTP